MNVRTKNAVTHLDMSKLATGGSRQGVVEMHLRNRNLVINLDKQGNELASVEVSYSLIDDQGNELPTEDGGVFTVKDSMEEPNEVLPYRF